MRKNKKQKWLTHIDRSCEEYSTDIAVQFAMYCERKNMSIKELAKKADVSDVDVGNLMFGLFTLSLHSYIKIVKALDCKMDNHCFFEGTVHSKNDTPYVNQHSNSCFVRSLNVKELAELSSLPVHIIEQFMNKDMNMTMFHFIRIFHFLNNTKQLNNIVPTEIMLHYASRVDAQILAKKAGVSVDAINKLFCRDFSISLKEYMAIIEGLCIYDCKVIPNLIYREIRTLRGKYPRYNSEALKAYYNS